MERIRRSKVVFSAALGLMAIALVSVVGARSMRPESLTLKVGATAGSLAVSNDGEAGIEVERALGIEMKTHGRWTPVAADFELISDCADKKKPQKYVTIPARSSISVVAWKGFSCSGQCEQPCRANVAYGPGVYRFVCTLTAGKKHVYSDAFEMPAVK